jgi:ABC-type antimicrobial peptide transport system permease subunit
MAPVRFTMTLIAIFAAVAVALAAIGLYGVLATIVRQRTAEIGMRLVFGAPRASILQLVVGEGMKMSAVGIVLGIAAAFAITRVMASLFVGISPTDPLTFAAITLLFIAVALVAAWMPAYRASRLDPMVAIREE